MRSSARKHGANTTVKSRLKTLERNYLEALKGGKKDVAATALRLLTSAFDKAAKTGVIHRGTANRKTSRLTIRLSAAAAAPASK